MAMAVAAQLNEEDWQRWVQTTLGLKNIRNLLIPCITTIMSEFHTELLSDVNNNDCRHCTKDDLAGNDWKAFPNCEQVHNVLLKAITQEHVQPGSIPWCNTKVQLWTQLYWEVAKMYMQKGIKKSNKGPEDTDIANMLTMMDHCRRFRNGETEINRHKIQQVIAVRNRVMHSSEYNLSEGDMNDCFERMLELLQDDCIQKLPQAAVCRKKLNQIRATKCIVIPKLDSTKTIDSLSEEELKSLAACFLLAYTESPEVQAGVPEEKKAGIHASLKKLSGNK